MRAMVLGRRIVVVGKLANEDGADAAARVRLEQPDDPAN
jgi:hypothetical protein